MVARGGRLRGSRPLAVRQRAGRVPSGWSFSPWGAWRRGRPPSAERASSGRRLVEAMCGRRQSLRCGAPTPPSGWSFSPWGARLRGWRSVARGRRLRGSRPLAVRQRAGRVPGGPGQLWQRGCAAWRPVRCRRLLEVPQRGGSCGGPAIRWCSWRSWLVGCGSPGRKPCPVFGWCRRRRRLWAPFPSLEALSWCFSRYPSGENLVPVFRSGDDGVFDVVSSLEASPRRSFPTFGWPPVSLGRSCRP